MLMQTYKTIFEGREFFVVFGGDWRKPLIIKNYMEVLHEHKNDSV